MTRRRILQICGSFPPFVGGTETHNFSLVKYLDEQGYDVEVLVVHGSLAARANEGYSSEIIRAATRSVYRLPELPNVRISTLISHPVTGHLALRRFATELQSRRGLDLVDAHSYAYYVALPSRFRTILSIHFFELTCPDSRWPMPCQPSYQTCQRRCRRKLRRYLYWRVTRDIVLKKLSTIMVKYQYAKTLLVEAGVPDEKIVVIPHWVPIPDYSEAARLGEDSVPDLLDTTDGFRFLFVGRLAEEKGCHLLLDAFERVLHENADARLVLVGDGPRRRALESQARRLGLGNKVRFLGRRPHSEIAQLLSQADCVVLPDLYFNYQWTLVEAAASGRPIVATDVVATREILEDGRNALLTSVDEESLAEGMQRILQDHTLAVRLGNAALETARERHSMRNLQLYENLVQEVASR